MAKGGAALEYFDDKFHDLTVADAVLETLYDGCSWAEGPVWFGDGNFLVWSDIPNNRMLKWVPGLAAHRMGRLDHHPGRPLPGQKAQFSQ
jgi:gluconolactonase